MWLWEPRFASMKLTRVWFGIDIAFSKRGWARLSLQCTLTYSQVFYLFVCCWRDVVGALSSALRTLSCWNVIIVLSLFSSVGGGDQEWLSLYKQRWSLRENTSTENSELSDWAGLELFMLLSFWALWNISWSSYRYFWVKQVKQGSSVLGGEMVAWEMWTA